MENKVSSSFAINFTFTSWHILDWLFNEKLNYDNLKYNREDFKIYRNDFLEKCKYLSIVQDISNGSKHAKISFYTPSVKSTKLEYGVYEEGVFEGDKLEVILEDGTRHDFEDIVKKIMSFWNDYFSNN